MLVISSFVAASRVGSSVSAFCLNYAGHETVILPTTLLGRHPGWGAPGGGPVPIQTLKDMWAAVKAQALTIDAVLTGYMADPAHVDLAADIIAYVKKTAEDALILVDPVMGDQGRLYVSEDIAAGIRDRLVPLADVITPNMWEFSFLTGAETPPLSAAHDLHPDVLITSYRRGAKIGGALITQARSAYVLHVRLSNVPHGGGDALAGLYLARRLNGDGPFAAMAGSVAAIYAIFEQAVRQQAVEFPLVAYKDALLGTPPLDLEYFEL